MIPHRSRASLGISIGDRSMRLAEVIRNGGGAPTARIAEFVYPDGLKLEDPQALGQELGRFLKSQGFTARRTLIGIPARWLIFNPYEVPATDESTATRAMWLYATEKTPRALGPMVFDYMGQCNPISKSTMLIVGLQEQWIGRLTTLATAAGLKLASLTPIASALSAVTAEHVSDAIVASFGPEGAELMGRDGPNARWIGQVRMNGSIGPAISQLRRALAGMRLDDDSNSVQWTEQDPRPQRKLVVWNSGSAEPALLDLLRASPNLSMVDASERWLGISGGDGKGLCEIALTQPPSPASERMINFLRPRVAPPMNRRAFVTGNWQPWAAAAALLFALIFADIEHLRGQISSADQKLQDLAPAVSVAGPFVSSMSFAEAFRTGSPHYLACLRDITDAIGPDGQTYLTEFNLVPPMKGDVNGSAANEQAVLNFRDKLNSSGRFTELNCKLDAGRRGAGNEVAFSLTFTYRPVN